MRLPPVELATLEWVAWFNHHRLMEPLGYIPPAEFEANYHRQRAGQAATAALLLRWRLDQAPAQIVGDHSQRREKAHR